MTSLTLRTHLAFSPRRLLSKPSLFSSAKTLTLVASSSSLGLGPSLRQGRRSVPEPAPDLSELSSVDRDSFTRVFDLGALRVPAAECSELERRLRGHLLNWPRIRNVARVPGDDMDPSMYKLLSRYELKPSLPHCVKSVFFRTLTDLAWVLCNLPWPHPPNFSLTLVLNLTSICFTMQLTPFKP